MGKSGEVGDRAGRGFQEDRRQPGVWGGYEVLEAVRRDDEEAARQRRWRTEGVPANPMDQPVLYGGELVSRGEVGRRKMWEEVRQICWAVEVGSRYFDYCWEVEEKLRKEWKVIIRTWPLLHLYFSSVIFHFMFQGHSELTERHIRARTLSYIDWLEVAPARDPHWHEYRLQREWRRWEAKRRPGEAVVGGEEAGGLDGAAGPELGQAGEVAGEAFGPVAGLEMGPSANVAGGGGGGDVEQPGVGPAAPQDAGKPDVP